MKPHKKIWELQPSTVCKVVGMALLPEDLQRIARKFGISKHDPLMDEEFVLHATIVQLCSRDNPVSRHTENLIEKRFAVHAKTISLDDPIQLIRSVRENPQDVDAPLWAILWGLATRCSLADAKIETALFGFIHMMEHRLLRDHWESVCLRGEEDSEVAGRDRETLSLKRELFDMQWANRRLEKFMENLRSQIDSSASPSLSPGGFPDSGISNEKDFQCATSHKVRKLKVLLDQARYCNFELESENAQLRDEIDGLFQELRSYEKEFANTAATVSDDSCPYANRLRGKKVTLVGGIESLECHYRQLIESLGGQFCRHDGICCGGEKALHDCILGSDLVVCPVEVNGHDAATLVKKICKARGVRCCFPRSASITGLRTALQEHCSAGQAA